jgi:hypothetical protein
MTLSVKAMYYVEQILPYSVMLQRQRRHLHDCKLHRSQV